MTEEELAFKPANELAKLIADKRLSPVELMKLYLGRIEDLDPRLNAFLTVSADAGLRAAEAAEKAILAGDEVGPLHGVPVAVKDLEATAGLKTTYGSLVYKNYVPDHDSVVVERLHGAGAVVIGKTNTPEFGLSATTQNRLSDDGRNPWDTSRTAGGSSGGSAAAVAAGMCPLATGGDAGGSIRIPGSFCGVFGIKPTLGRVPRFGGVGRPAPNPIAQNGPIARTVEDAALMLQVIAGLDDRDVTSIRQTPPDFRARLDEGVRGLKIAWTPDFGYGAVDREVVAITAEAARLFEELGAIVEAPDVRVDDPRETLRSAGPADMYASYGHLLKERRDDLSDVVVKRLEAGKLVTGTEYAVALRRREELKYQVAVLMETYDLLVSPTMAVTAFPIGEPPLTIAGRTVEPESGFNPFNPIFNHTGHPAASIPCGLSADGLPVGLHVAGRLGDEATVLRAAAAFEQARPWPVARMA